jgi:outer membrane protein TolC
MPLDDSVVLTTGIENPTGPSLPAVAVNVAPDTSSNVRAPVRELDETVNQAEAQVRIARSQRIPSLAIVSNYQRLYFPTNVFPSLTAGVNNWTLGLSTNFPILDGGRIKGDVAVAQAGLQQARATRNQAKQFASFDARVALGLLAEAEAVFAASRGTADQAQRAYAIDQVRYQEGISTQTDLSASRLLLEQARTNRAQAARDLAVAQVRLALLKDLPLQLSGTPNAQQQQQQQQQQRQQTQAQQQQNAAARGPGSPQP